MLKESVILVGVVLILLTITTGSWACETPFENCGESPMVIKSVVVPGCCNPPCAIKRGTNVSILITYVSSISYASLDQDLCGLMPGFCFKLQSLPKDFCSYGSCPIVANVERTVKTGLPINSSYPPLTLSAKWSFYEPSQKSELVGCFTIPLKLV